MELLSASDGVPTGWGAALGASLMVVVIFVVMITAAITWSKHGFFPTRGFFGRTTPLTKTGRERFERWNRETGWGDTGDEPPPPASDGRPQEQ